jgi:Leu/Phe-tRNA-protein transferase
MRTAYEQTSVSGLGALFHLGKDNHQPSIGNTAVYAVRLPQSTINLIKDCANNKHQGVSEWASAALFAWYLSFKAYQESHKDADADWVEEYARLYRVRVNEVGRVYALKAGREVS